MNVYIILYNVIVIPNINSNDNTNKTSVKNVILLLNVIEYINYSSHLFN